MASQEAAQALTGPGHAATHDARAAQSAVSAHAWPCLQHIDERQDEQAAVTFGVCGPTRVSPASVQAPPPVSEGAESIAAPESTGTGVELLEQATLAMTRESAMDPTGLREREREGMPLFRRTVIAPSTAELCRQGQLIDVDAGPAQG
jgi:hypothetical protein